MTLLIPPPHGGWCTGHYALRVEFFNEGECYEEHNGRLTPCPDEVPVGRATFRVVR